ncbi:hypothetical protein MA16_Dca028436 [Dendrobium catenatum]|uniref:Uncharacterized protein n=1 Tax=Dendrobium catenatum TaxID=906689 RepID=A0A2I0VG17_9ASPA|nr:hypothetical protein MA16_Dca028436 [Dendrobium catenatum]
MEEKAPPALHNTNAIVLVLVIGIVINLTFTTARPIAMAASGCKALPQYVATSSCKALPQYVAESCAAAARRDESNEPLIAEFRHHKGLQMSNERCTIEGFNIGRPFDHSLFAPDLTPIYKPCHSRKIINRALILHNGKRSKREKKRRRREEGGESTPRHRRSSSRHLNTPEFYRIFRKRRNSAQLPRDAEILPN